MEQQRTFLFLILIAISFLIWQQWQADYGPKPKTTVSETSGEAVVPDKPGASTPSSSEGEMPVPSASSQPQSTTPKPPVEKQPSAGQDIVVETDLVRAVIDTQGGDIKHLDLLKYPVAVEKPDQPFRLLDQSAQRNFVAQSGFYVPDSESLREQTPGRKTVYQVTQTRYQITADGKAQNIDLTWRNRAGVEFIIRYTFTPGSYLINVSHIVNNAGANSWKGNVYLRMQRTPPTDSKGMAMLPTYLGAVYYSPEEKYQKVDFDDIDDANPNGTVRDAINQEFAGGWAAFIEHYFVGAYIPPKEEAYRYFTAKLDNRRYLVGMSSPQHEVAPGAQKEIHSKLFVGPKLQNVLEGVAPGLELSVDYGWLTIIAKPLFWVLDFLHGLVGNWGWAIILLTILIKLAFYKLSEASYKSMANMKRVAPRMQQLKERYAGDRQKMNQALMDMYRKEKINPLGGCFPILIQIPVFIALYYVLLESVELRQADWIFWFNDLSTKDPYFVLPILMGASMLIQQKLNPAPMDPIQAKMMMFLPVVFTVLFLFFPSGLVLYWVVNNVLSITQQWYITKHVMAEKKVT
jgi:YidC/Oxa1 family membrane protein insertase